MRVKQGESDYNDRCEGRRTGTRRPRWAPPCGPASSWIGRGCERPMHGATHSVSASSLLNHPLTDHLPLSPSRRCSARSPCSAAWPHASPAPRRRRSRSRTSCSWPQPPWPAERRQSSPQAPESGGARSSSSLSSGSGRTGRGPGGRKRSCKRSVITLSTSQGQTPKQRSVCGRRGVSALLLTCDEPTLSPFLRFLSQHSSHSVWPQDRTMGTQREPP